MVVMGVVGVLGVLLLLLLWDPRVGLTVPLYAVLCVHQKVYVCGVKKWWKAREKGCVGK